jgi:hypothetical protein
MLRTLSTRLGRSSFLSAIGTRSVSTSAARFADGGGDAAASDKQRVEVGSPAARHAASVMHMHSDQPLSNTPELVTYYIC